MLLIIFGFQNYSESKSFYCSLLQAHILPASAVYNKIDVVKPDL
jgi:hypothetical protein